MTAAIVQGATFTQVGGSAGAADYGSNVTSGNLLVVVIIGNASATSATSTRSGAYTKAVESAASGGGFKCSIWYAIATSSGTCTVTTAPTTNEIIIYEFSGVTALDVVTSAVGTSGIPSIGPITTSSASEALVCGVAYAGANTGPGTGWTGFSTLNSNLSEEQITTSAGAFTGTANNSDTDWSGSIASFKAAGTAPAAIYTGRTPFFGSFRLNRGGN